MWEFANEHPIASVIIIMIVCGAIVNCIRALFGRSTVVVNQTSDGSVDDD